VLSDLSDQTLASHFVRERGVGTDRSAQALVDRVEAWLSRNGLSHRSALAVAVEANRLAEQRAAPPAAPSPEEVTWREDIRQGTTATDPTGPVNEQELGARVAQMDMAAYSKFRQQAGIGMSRDHGLGGFVRAGEYA
jgi:hypothetical protein